MGGAILPDSYLFSFSLGKFKKSPRTLRNSFLADITNAGLEDVCRQAPAHIRFPRE
jgi:hypothetical protein